MYPDICPCVLLLQDGLLYSMEVCGNIQSGPCHIGALDICGISCRQEEASLDVFGAGRLPYICLRKLFRYGSAFHWRPASCSCSRVHCRNSGCACPSYPVRR